MPQVRKNPSAGQHAVMLYGVKMDMNKSLDAFNQAAARGVFAKMLSEYENYSFSCGALEMHISGANLTYDPEYVRLAQAAFNTRAQMHAALVQVYRERGQYA